MVFNEWVRQILGEEVDQIEKACEEMLVRGEGGVMITRDSSGFLKSAVWSDNIPYGCIYEYRDSGKVT